MEKNHKIELTQVKKSDAHFLYEMLKDRDPIVNISHKSMPSYENHVKFVMSKPYSKWYIIKYNGQKVGSVYLSKQNEVGLFIKKECQKLGLGNKALQNLIKLNPRDRFLANCNPKNLKSKKFFEKNNFKLIQHTYELIKKK